MNQLFMSCAEWIIYAFERTATSPRNHWRDRAAVQLNRVDIGDSCKRVIERERGADLRLAFGANATEAQDTIVFKDTSVAGQITQLIVTCSGAQRTVARYHVTTWTPNEAAARRTFTSVKDSLTRQLGAPKSDDDLTPTARKVELAAITAKYYQYMESLRFGTGKDQSDK